MPATSYVDFRQRQSGRPLGGIGRHTGLKILRNESFVPVRVRQRAPDPSNANLDGRALSLTEIFHHRGCRIEIASGATADGDAIIRYVITPESDVAKAAFRRQGVDMISGSKMSDLVLGASRREVDLLMDGRG